MEHVSALDIPEQEPVELLLPCSLIAIIDEEDLARALPYSWHSLKIKGRNTIYVQGSFRQDWGRPLLHRFIMNAKRNDIIDPIDGNGLNNRKCNLRFVTQQQNLFNKRPYRDCSSKYKGIHWDEKRQKWVGQLKKDGERVWIAYFNSEDDAAVSYDKKAIEHFGEYAYLNFQSSWS